MAKEKTISEEIISVTMTDGTDKSKKKTTVRVEKITNGYIMSEETEWDEPKKGWQYKTIKTYYEENPLKKINI